MLEIREYRETDWKSVDEIHDRARKMELKLAGLEDAFVPLETAAKREGLFDYPGLFAAELDGKVVGFAACTEEEFAWLYVSPAHMRKGVGRQLARYVLRRFPNIRYVEALKGNEPARALYESLGFRIVKTEKGQMPGNEEYTVEVYLMERQTGE